MKHTLERIGGAIIATTIILCSGTAIVAFAELPQVALFGQLFVITLALALLGDLFILPALLVAGGKFFDPIGGSGRTDDPDRASGRGHGRCAGDRRGRHRGPPVAAPLTPGSC